MCPPFHVRPPGFCIHLIQYFENVAPPAAESWRRACPHLIASMDTRIGKANADLRELGRSVVAKRKVSNTAGLSVFKAVFVPIFTHDHESWVMTGRILTQVQAPEMGFLRRFYGVTQGRTEVRWRPGKQHVWRPHVRT